MLARVRLVQRSAGLGDLTGKIAAFAPGNVAFSTASTKMIVLAKRIVRCQGGFVVAAADPSYRLARNENWPKSREVLAYFPHYNAVAVIECYSRTARRLSRNWRTGRLYGLKSVFNFYPRCYQYRTEALDLPVVPPSLDYPLEQFVGGHEV